MERSRSERGGAAGAVAPAPRWGQDDSFQRTVDAHLRGRGHGRPNDRPDCRFCGTTAVKNGTTRHGKRCWRCPSCGRQWTQDPGGRVHPKVVEIADRMIRKGMSVAEISELCDVHRSWVYRRRDRSRSGRRAG